jgi:hypothetical protein
MERNMDDRIEGSTEGRMRASMEARMDERTQGRIEGSMEGRMEGRKEGKIEGGVPRMSALFFHQPPIYERATDHTYTKGCGHLGTKCGWDQV